MINLSRRSVLLAAPAILLARGARAETVLRVGDQRGGVAAVMKAADALRDLPYRLEWSQFSAAAPLLEAVNANAVDTAFAGDAPVTFALASGVEARIIAATRGTGASTAIVVPGDSPIRSLADLRGKRIATNRGSIGHALVLAAAEAGGWAASEVKMVNLLPADAKAALASGAVDAWSTWNTYIAQAQITDGARVVVDGSNGLLTGLSFQIARTDAIRTKRDALADYVGRVARAKLWALGNPDAFSAVLATEIGVSQAIALRSFQTDRGAPVRLDDGVAADEQRTADRYANARVIPQRLDTGPAFDRSFNGAALG
jgi:sulfonate transport system substrate-binding protein